MARLPARLADPWRTVARVQLAGNQTAFGLALLGLPVEGALGAARGGGRPASDAAGPGSRAAGPPRGAAVEGGWRALEDAVAARLQAALRGYPELHRRLAWRADLPRMRPHAPLDVLVVRPGPGGPVALRLLPDPARPVDLHPGLRDLLDRALLDLARLIGPDRPLSRSASMAAATARTLSGRHTPATLSRKAARAYVRRVLAATVLAVEPAVTRSQRLTLPPLHPLVPFGQGALEARLRLAPGGGHADLWVRAQHAAVDGAPVADFLSTLRAAWGGTPPVLVPSPLTGAAVRAADLNAGPDGVVAVPAVVDLGPVLALRRTTSAGRAAPSAPGPATDGPVASALAAPAASTPRPAGPPAAPMPLAALVGWLLTRHPAFAGDVVAVPVDLPATSGRARTATVAVLDPAARELAGARDAFATELALARRGANRFGRALRAAGLLATRQLAIVSSRVGDTRATTGSIGVSVLRPADVFVPSINDAYRCYLGIGTAGRPADGGGRAAAVVLKCRRRELATIAAAVDEVLADPARFA
jgi:hypothetical protein